MQMKDKLMMMMMTHQRKKKKIQFDFKKMSRRVHAGVVKVLGESPVYESIEIPAAEEGGDEVEIEVEAVGIHRITRSIANGQHYIKGELPMIVGIDGVGTLSNGQKVYFVKMKTRFGTMSEYVHVHRDSTIALPDSVDSIEVAALMNAGIGSWVALRERARIQNNETVLILGVTGTTGQLAAQSARLLGAKRIIGIGRNTSILDDLFNRKIIDRSIVFNGNDDEVKEQLNDEINEIDIVIDYLWGKPAELVLTTIQSTRTNSVKRLRWIEVGQMAGPTIQLSAALLRSQNIEFSGNGIGPLSFKQILTSLQQMIPFIENRQLTTSIQTFHLKDIEQQWKQTSNIPQRVVVLIK